MVIIIIIINTFIYFKSWKNEKIMISTISHIIQSSSCNEDECKKSNKNIKKNCSKAKLIIFFDNYYQIYCEQIC